MACLLQRIWQVSMEELSRRVVTQALRLVKPVDFQLNYIVALILSKGTYRLGALRQAQDYRANKDIIFEIQRV
jgi:hypothetical protein